MFVMQGVKSDSPGGGSRLHGSPSSARKDDHRPARPTLSAPLPAAKQLAKAKQKQAGNKISAQQKEGMKQSKSLASSSVEGLPSQPAKAASLLLPSPPTSLREKPIKEPIGASPPHSQQSERGKLYKICPKYIISKYQKKKGRLLVQAHQYIISEPANSFPILAPNLSMTSTRHQRPRC